MLLSKILKRYSFEGVFTEVVAFFFIRANFLMFELFDSFRIRLSFLIFKF